MEAMFKETACLSLGEIEAYHKGDLSGAQLRRVEHHLMDCALCDGALEGFNKRSDKVQDQIQLRKLNKAISSSSRPLPFFLNKAVAAILILIVATSFLLYWQHNKGDRLFAQLYETPVYEGSQQRGSSEAIDNNTMRQKAFVAFGQKNYAQAAELFESYLSEEANDFEAIFYAGIAQIEGHNLEKAIQYFQSTRLNDDEQYEGATWYLALAYVQQKEYEQAGLLAQEIEMTSNPIYRAKAIALLDKLGIKH